MEYEWDETKNEANIANGRMGFDAMREFEWDTSVIQQSDRGGEVRWAATGYIGNRLHRVVYTLREDKIRIIRFRMASRKEERDYAED